MKGMDVLSSGMNHSSRRASFIRKGLLFLLIVFCLPLVAAAEETPPSQPESSAPDMIEELKLFSKAIGVILEAYPEDLEKRQLLYEAVKGMMASLDKYSEFIDPERYELFQIHMRGEYAGIGAILHEVNGYPAVRGIQPGSAADKSGVLAGDIILKINGEDTKGMGLPEASKRMRGEENTTLILTLQRLLPPQIFDLEITREKIMIDSIKDVRIVGKAVGYMRMDNWQDHTIEEFDRAMETLESQKLKALVIDLRDNDGGLMPQAVALAERFLEKGKMIVSVDSKIEEQRKEYMASGEPALLKYPLIVLVNEVSASASEIFSAAMQDHKRGIVVGMPTYGKASVQSVIPLDDESAMKLTTARYLSPAGRDINQVGIQPDFVIENDAEETGDQQVAKALELFRAYM